MPEQDRSAVMDDDRRKQDAARNRERLDDDVAEQGQRGTKDEPPREDDNDRMSER
jgi:hypothetical protein